MRERTYKIGQLSRKTGISVGRLRFYADKGLLPPAERSAAGYRMFTDTDMIRVDLICALRNAGISIAAIRNVLSGSASMTGILELRLAELNAHIRKQRRTAAVLGAVLRSPEPASGDNMRRIWTMTSISATEYNAAIESFIGKVAKDDRVDTGWKQRIARMTQVELTDQPTTAQIDAWIELRELLNTPIFVQQMRENARDTFAQPLDKRAFKRMQDTILPQARDAMAEGLEPSSQLGQTIARRYLEGWARAIKVEPDKTYWERMRRKHFLHKPNMARFWDLVFTIGGNTRGSEPDPVWMWIDEAANLLLAET
ncbi:MAG: MerR family transcriptional regulator [Pseudomonadota bacterium]